VQRFPRTQLCRENGTETRPRANCYLGKNFPRNRQNWGRALQATLKVIVWNRDAGSVGALEVQRTVTGRTRRLVKLVDPGIIIDQGNWSTRETARNGKLPETGNWVTRETGRHWKLVEPGNSSIRKTGQQGKLVDYRFVDKKASLFSHDKVFFVCFYYFCSQCLYVFFNSNLTNKAY
jgi:hypothetical protein